MFCQISAKSKLLQLDTVVTNTVQLYDVDSRYCSNCILLQLVTVARYPVLVGDVDVGGIAGFVVGVIVGVGIVAEVGAVAGVGVVT